VTLVDQYHILGTLEILETNCTINSWPYQGICIGGGQKRGAEGAEVETPKASRERGIGRGQRPPQPTRGLGERRELPQRGPGLTGARLSYPNFHNSSSIVLLL